MTYTVIAHDDETGVVVTDDINAATAEEAMRSFADDSFCNYLVICAVCVDGVETPCPDTGKSAYCSDLRTEGEGDDVCDACGRSGVAVDQTDADGRTVCAECAECAA